MSYKIYLYDTDYDCIGSGALSSSYVQWQLETAAGQDVEVHISSVGSSAFDAIAIYDLLKKYPGNVTTYIDALAASAASIVAMGGQTVFFSFLLTILIHNISGRFNLFFGTFERVLCVAFFNVLFILVVNKKASFLKIKWLLSVGAISYALYLIHESFGINVSIFLFHYLNKSLSVICGIVASIFTAALITYFFERPVQKWLKSKYFTH